MAKKKVAKAATSGIPQSSAISAVTGKYGGGVLMSGSSLLAHADVVSPICPNVDAGLGGGLLEGTFNTFSGAPRCGKTTLALHAAGNAQKHFKKKVRYINAEVRLRPRDLADVENLSLDGDDFLIIQSEEPTQNEQGVWVPGEILTAEKILDITEAFIMNEVGSVIILDSISVLCEEAEWVGGLGTQTRGGAQKLFAQFMRRMMPVISTNRHIFIGIVHLMANTSGFGAKWLEKMSNSAQYAVSTKIRAEQVQRWTVGDKDTEDAKQIGQKTIWRVERSPLSPPGEKVTSYLKYGSGIDEVTENIIKGDSFNLVEKSGSWYYLKLDGEVRVKAQGLENFRNALVEDREAYEGLARQVREYCCFESPRS
jgi:recombination protein RecA